MKRLFPIIAAALLLGLIAVLAGPGLSRAQEKQNAGGLDEVLGGFEDEEKAPEKEAAPPEKPKPSFLDLSGSLSLGGSYAFTHDPPLPGRTDWRGLSRLSPKLALDLEARFSPEWKAKVNGHAFYDLAYSIKGREDFTTKVLNTYEQEAEIDQAWVQGRLLSGLDLKFGRQIVVWGKSDSIRVVDVLNPVDNREPGLVDLEDLRLPLAMTRLDYYFGPWNLSGAAVHEIRFNKDPVYGSDFYPMDFPPPQEEVPESGGENTELGLALKGMFSGWDVSFFWARFFDDQAHLEVIGVGPLGPVLVRGHSLLTMVGGSANLARGNWLLKAEAAHFDGLEFFNLPRETRSRLDLMAGLEYSGFRDAVLSLEMVNRHIVDFDEKLKQDPDQAEEDETMSVVRLTRNFLNDSLEMTVLALFYGLSGQGGALERLSVKYELSDHWSITGGLALYSPGQRAVFENIGDKDRFFFEAKYSF